jgi:glutamyl-tRNA reductase
MQDVAVEVVSIADACLGGLRGRSALVIGPYERRRPYVGLLQQAGMKYVYQEDTTHDASSIIPHIQLLIHIPSLAWPRQVLTAGSVALGCTGRRTPLLIFDLAEFTSVEELAGLLPAVCLYTPEDLRHILPKMVKIPS